MVIAIFTGGGFIVLIELFVGCSVALLLLLLGLLPGLGNGSLVCVDLGKDMGALKGVCSAVARRRSIFMVRQQVLSSGVQFSSIDRGTCRSIHFVVNKGTQRVSVVAVIFRYRRLNCHSVGGLMPDGISACDASLLSLDVSLARRVVGEVVGLVLRAAAEQVFEPDKAPSAHYDA